MSADRDDLLELFLAEAGERLARLVPLVARAGTDEEAAAEIRRELHALKGAARMLGLTGLAETCHRAEEAAGRGGGGVDAEALVRLVDRIAAGVRELGPSPDAPAGEGVEGAATPEGLADAAYVPAPALDRLTDEATTLRIAALGFGHLVHELEELLRLVERPSGGGDPEQLAALLGAGVRRITVRAEGAARRLERLAGAHREALLALQMQPIEPFLHELARHGRELAEQLGKRVEVRVEAGGVRLDRRIVRALESSLLHLVRNAVDHGIEPPADRTAAGKPERGSVVLSARAAGDRVRVVVRDDGRGLDPERIVATARERGILADEETPVPEELVIRAGFTTRGEVSQISGRGIGLDAVAAAVRSLGGELALRSEPGRGLTVELDLPSIRRGLQVVVVTAGPAVVAVPAERVRSCRRLAGLRVDRGADGALVAALDTGAAPVAALGGAGDAEMALELVTGHGPVVLAAGTVLGREEVVVRPLPARAARGTAFDGMAVLAGGRPVPVLAPDRLQPGRQALRAAPEDTAGHAQRPAILLVDDSPVTRTMERRLLEDAGFEVTAVADGAEALALLGQRRFHCLVTDIEMPGIDGLELTRRVRALPALADLPVVVVSTRDRPADRLAGLEAGADAYVAKQELRADLLADTIRRLVGEAGGSR